MVDIATRVYNHSWRLDPVIRSLLDTDFYKLLMLQLIWREHRDVERGAIRDMKTLVLALSLKVRRPELFA